MTAVTSPPLVSIIVPVYNAESYLRASLDSIVAQSYPHREILVMDDASTDGSAEIIASYGDRVMHHRQPANRGQFANVNAGLALAQGKYIAIYHADDIYAPTIVEREVAYLENHPDAGAVFCLDIFVNAQGKEYGRLRLPPELETDQPLSYVVIVNGLLTYKNRFLVGPTSMVRASVYRELGPYRGEEYRIAADLEMWARIAKHYPIGIVREHLHYYRHGHGNLSQNYYHLRTETEIHFKILDRHLAGGALALATSEALAAHEAHRAEDRLMVAINCYIRDDREKCRRFLRTIHLRGLLGSRQVQRARLLILYWMLQMLSRLPRLRIAADTFYRRWHRKQPGPANTGDTRPSHEQ